jgi:hypothetical protein
MSSEARPLAIKDVTVIDITDAPRMSPHETLVAANELNKLQAGCGLELHEQSPENRMRTIR